MGIYLQNVVAGTWTNFGEIIAPLAFSKTLKDNIASCTVNIFFESTAVSTALLMPGTIVRLVEGATAIDYFVVEDASKSDSSSIDPFSIHTYKLSELLAITREVYVQTSFFSNGQYTMAEFFTRLFALCKSDHALAISTSYDYSVALSNWQNPDYQVSSNSLLDNLFKIGKMLGVRFKATYSPSTDIITITCNSLKGGSTVASLGTSKNGSLSQYMASNYAAKVVANVENMTADQEHWFPENDNVYGCVAEPDNDANRISAVSELVLVLPHPIRSASEVRVSGLTLPGGTAQAYTIGELYDKDSTLIGDSSAEILDYLGTLTYISATTMFRNLTGITVSVHVVEYREWLLLDENGTGAATYHKENTLYYKRNENKIYNLEILSGICDGSGEFDTDPLYFTGSGASVPVYQYLYPQYNYYTVKCNLYLDGQIVETNGTSSERAAIYSQNENLVAGKTLVANMQGYIDSMTNADETDVFETDTLAGCAALGAVYNSKVIHTINYEVVYNSVKVQYELSDDVVPKSEYVSADGGLMLPDITTNKVYNRYTNYSTTLWFCRTQAIASAILSSIGADTYAQSGFITYALDSLSNGRTNKGMIPAEILVRTGEFETSEVHTAIDLCAKAVNTALLISWATRDNLSVGTYFTDGGSATVTNYLYLPVTFINDTGESKYITYKITDDSVRSTEANFPAIAEATFDNATSLVIIDDKSYYHDDAERINGIYQANFKPYNSADKVHQTFIEESSLLNDTLNIDDLYTRYVKIGSTNYTVYSVNATTPATGIRKISVSFTGESPTVGTAYACTFLRILDGTSTEEKMLEITCTIEDAPFGRKYAVFYVAFTK